MVVAALTSSRRGWRITKATRHGSPHGHGSAGPDTMSGTPWGAFSHALSDGWQATRPTYNPDSRLWSVWAVPPSSIRTLPVRGFGPTAAASIVDLAERLRDGSGRPR